MIRLVGADNNKIAADIDGDIDGQLVLLLHGAGQTRQSWNSAQQALAERGYLPICVDARGHGDSEWTPSGYTLDDFAADLQQIIKRVSRPVVIVGASMGGLTAMLALIRQPDIACSALILVDVVPKPNPAGVTQILEFMSAHPDGFASLEDAANSVAAYIPGRPRPASTVGLAKNLRCGSDGRYRWHWDPALLSHRLGDFDYAGDMEQLLRTTRIPLMLIRGKSSNVVTDSEADYFRDLAPQARVVDISGAAHMVSGDQNDLFVNAITTFLN